MHSGQNFDPSSLESGNFLPPEIDPEPVHLDVRFLCPIHGGLLRHPVQTSCGHRLCRTCLVAYLDGEESKPCPVDDEDKELVSVDTVFPDPGFLREIKSLLVYCVYKTSGCKDTMEFKDLASHLPKCDYRPVPCTYGTRGCPETLVMCFQHHHEPTCVYQPVACEQCGHDSNLMDQKEHQENNCPENVISCRYKCDAKFKRKEMEDHFNTCPMKPKECRYKMIGCSFQADQITIAQHEKDIFGHFEILVPFVFKMEMEIKAIFAACGMQHFAGLQEKLTFVESTLAEMSNDYQEKIVANREKVVSMEKHVKDMKKEQRGIQLELQGLNEAIEKLNNDILNIRDNLPKALQRAELRLAEDDLRFNMIEAASYDGALMWKISNFTTKRMNAAHGRVTSLYSHPFYSSQYGYKMCARIYLNGDGIGKGTHLSLYFLLVKGQYDSLLPWPFQMEVMLMLYDQSPHKRHLKDSFFPDPNSTSFKRPDRSEMNVASGCPRFVSHSVIDNPDNQYIKDDTMFIKVSVDGSRLA